jgi:hypothetical protein
MWVRLPPAAESLFRHYLAEYLNMGGIRHDYFLESPLCVEFRQL